MSLWGFPMLLCVAKNTMAGLHIEAWGEKRIRYPCIPRRKRWILTGGSVDPFTGKANALSIPPGKYAGNGETQRNRRGFTQAVDHVA